MSPSSSSDRRDRSGADSRARASALAASAAEAAVAGSAPLRAKTSRAKTAAGSGPHHAVCTLFSLLSPGAVAIEYRATTVRRLSHDLLIDDKRRARQHGAGVQHDQAIAGDAPQELRLDVDERRRTNLRGDQSAHADDDVGEDAELDLRVTHDDGSCCIRQSPCGHAEEPLQVDHRADLAAHV